jgi:hypothetical protein
LISIDLVAEEEMEHSARLLLDMMEFYRVLYGYPMAVAGTFGADFDLVLNSVLESTGAWRYCFVPLSINYMY